MAVLVVVGDSGNGCGTGGDGAILHGGDGGWWMLVVVVLLVVVVVNSNGGDGNCGCGWW